MINADDEVSLAYLIDPTFEIVNTEGRPLTGGYIEVYLHGTRTKYYCYSDWSGTLHPFKIPLDSLGANIILASPAHSYDIYIYNKYDSLVMSRYNVIPATGDGSVIKDVVTITSNDNTVAVTSSDQTNWNLSIKDTVDRVEQNEQDISDIKGDIEDIQEDLSNKKDKQSELVYGGNTHMTITRIKQNENGDITEVKYEPIDLPPEVPNVEITSPNGTIDVQSSTDTQTNTKTFSIDVNTQDPVWHYWTGNNAWTQVNTSSWTQINRPAIGAGSTPHAWNPDIKRGIYDVKAHFTVTFHNYENSKTVPNQIIQVGFRAKFVGKNDPTAINYVDLGSWTYDPSLYTTEAYQYNFAQESLRQNHDTSKILNVPNYWGDTDFNVYFEAALLNTDGSQSVPSIDTVLFAEINYFGYHEVKGNIAGQGGGTTYTAGDGIDITNDVISTNIAVQNAEKVSIDLDFGNTIQTVTSITTDGSTVRTDGFNFTLPTIKAGDGIEFTKVGTETTIAMDSEVGDVVETVEKLKKDLDTQITVNFDMPNITHTYDFANRSVTTLANGATMLCQAFTIPINHEIRVQTVGEDEPTLLGIYAKQQFGYKIMLALYVYDFETGFTDYVGDTGPVYVQAGRNEYPLVHKNPNITELTSSCVYYASLYLPSTSQVNGLYLASCPSYNDASYINATPRFTVGVENITYNNQEIDMTDATTGRLDYSDGLGNYYIGPWSDSYNERPSAPRFFMQLRNGTAAEPYVPAAPFTTLGANAMPTSSDLCSNLPNFTPSANNSCFRDVIPEADCDVTYFEWLDDTSSAAGWVQSNCVYNSGFDTNLSGNNNVVTNLGEVTTIDGHSLYRHRLTFGTALHLTANVTYRFLCEAFTDTGYVFSRSNNTNTIHVTNNGWYIELQNMTRYNNIIGKYLKVCAEGTDYEI